MSLRTAADPDGLTCESPITAMNRALRGRRHPPSPLRASANELLKWRSTEFLTAEVTQEFLDAWRTALSPEPGTLSPASCNDIMKQRLEKLSHDSFMAKHVKEKIREKISSEQETYSTAVGIIKKERKQSIRARLEARLDARMAGVIAPSDRMGVLTERDRV